jgi:type VI secretion system secreted protein Hcp
MAELFLMLDNNKIEGESTDIYHPKEIEILQWSWKMSNDAGHKLGAKDAAAQSKIHGITIQKMYDKSSVTLVKCLALGHHIGDAAITCRKNVGENEKLDYLIIWLKDVMVTEINWTEGTARDGSPESFTLSFLQFDIQYRMQSNEGGSTEGGFNFGFDIPSHKAI